MGWMEAEGDVALDVGRQSWTAVRRTSRVASCKSRTSVTVHLA
jgi:hypothetical protein